MNKIEDYDINLNCEQMDGIRPMASVSWSNIKFSPWLTSIYETHWKMINLVFYQKGKDTCTFILTSHPSTAQVKDCIEHTITGRMWVICPVSSNTITDVEMVCVTAADIAAAPVYHKTKTVGTYNYDQLLPWKLKEMTKSLGVESLGIQDYLDHGASKEPINSCSERIHHFLWCMWSEWSQITDHEMGHPKGMHPRYMQRTLSDNIELDIHAL